MKTIVTLKALDQLEDKLLEKYVKHPVLNNLSLFGEEEFLFLVKQRAYLALFFVLFNEFSLIRQLGNNVQKVFKDLVLDEYLEKEGFHRVALGNDLRALGIEDVSFGFSAMTPETQKAVFGMSDVIAACKTDAELLCAVRFWGELSVSVEYGLLWKRMKTMGLTQKTSEFYYPHYEHDAKRSALTSKSFSGSHSDYGAKVLVGEIENSSDQINRCAKIEQQVSNIKLSFWDQFKN